MFNSIHLTKLAASVADAMGVPAPKQADEGMPEIAALVKANAKSGKAERVLIYNPDCIAFWLYQKYTEKFIPVMTRTSMALPMLAVFPPVTPVCFGTMYTGAMPAVHGIEKYEKPIIRIDTLFEALQRGGKKVALIVREGSSMSKIFLERRIDYFFCDSDREVEDKALELIEKDVYDFLCVYHMDYDDAIHDTTPESERSLAALDRHNASFAALSDAVKKYWAQYDTLIAYCPDHGVHKTIMGVGDHFADIPEDMNMIHFWGFYPKQ